MPEDINAEFTEQKRLFCDEYIRLRCAYGAGQKAAQFAGYKGPYWSQKAGFLLKERKVKKYISEVLYKQQHGTHIEIGKNIAELKTIAFSKITDYTEHVDVYGKVIVESLELNTDNELIKVQEEKDVIVGSELTVLQYEDMPDHSIAAIGEISNERGKSKVRLHDKIAAIRELNNMLRFLTPENPEAKSLSMEAGSFSLKRRAYQTKQKDDK